MTDIVVSSYDPKMFMEQSGWNYSKSWDGKIDVSLWVNTFSGDNARVYLLLEYEDASGKRSVPVDRYLSRISGSVLLNGRVLISGKGALKSIALKIRAEDCPSAFTIEELTVKAATGGRISSRLGAAV